MTATRAPLTGAALRGCLVRLTAAVLERSPDDVSAHDAFAALGADSLRCAELIAEIEDELGVSLPDGALYEHPTIESLAVRLEGGPSPFAPPAPDRALELMRRDARLPDDVRPGAPRGRATGAVLVTGATGFVGAHLVHELLSRGRRAVCLVRGDDGARRLAASLRRYGLPTRGLAERATICRGDLALPRLGLPADRFAELARSVDEIHHAGAEVDWVQPYERLRAANVLGTTELLRLACAGGALPVHFVSSLAVCYSLDAGHADESLDATAHVAGVQLGYARSKCVAEALVREAGRRGLPVRIVRPALVAGHATSGASNVDDLIALLIRGCIALGAAPDLDWTLDAVPVDHLVRTIVGLDTPRPGGDDVVHVVDPASRGWRECVLWMHLRGHALRLLPFPEWAELVRREAIRPDHPLFGLRGFLLRGVPRVAGIFLPQTYENDRRTIVDSAASHRRTVGIVGACPPLNAATLVRWFGWYEEAGVVPRTGRGVAGDGGDARAHLEPLRRNVEERLRLASGEAALGVTCGAASPLAATESIVAELTAWRSGAATGLFRSTFVVRGPAGTRALPAIVKVKCADQHVLEVAESLAALCDAELGAAYAAHREHTGFTRGHLRELALYETDEARWRAHTPALLGVARDPVAGWWALALEDVHDVVAGGSASTLWTDAQIGVALDGIAQLHAIWFQQAARLDAPWLPPHRSRERMVAMAPLWRALAAHARPLCARVGGEALATTAQHLAESVHEWYPADDEHPLTLIHNDCNPRNLLLRGAAGTPTLCALDWELARVGMPQRDVAELLCFVLDPAPAAAGAERWSESARAALAGATGSPLEPEAWRRGMVAALRELLVDRLASYVLVHRVRSQHFLPRVLRTWHALHSTLSG